MIQQSNEFLRLNLFQKEKKLEENKIIIKIIKLQKIFQENIKININNFIILI